ncbi:site-specific integrase [Paraburkholderia saeva]|uniref:Tyrosine recombinase XerC n=1 Tax=Paraburkholderia saeva TaxID=2777537 RepID=A0A9N8X246_9BURK|nr:site-specific integrase [Paraburkholderia saeva]CAG4906404.1 Tyrosine recombinase XerC [Paraburkholderia saeva]
MATKRMRPSGTWEYIVRRKGILPKPLSLTFDTEAEGDVYVRRLEQMLDAGILPEDLVERRSDLITVDDAIRSYMTKVSLPSSDASLLNALVGRWRSHPLTGVDYQWAEGWVKTMKRKDILAPSTIRHYVGALARCFDWVVRSGSPSLATNPLRLLPKRYATYTDEDTAAVRVQDKAPKEDIHRDQRLMPDAEAVVRRILAGEKPESRQRGPELNYRPAMVFLFELAIESAMRMREMYTLELGQVDVDRRTVFLDKTKNGSKRQVPLTTVAIRAFENYVDAVKDEDPEMSGFEFDGGRLFPWWDGSRDRKVLAGVSVRLSGQFGRIFDAAGCGQVTFHDLRHEATSRLYEKTNLSDIQIAKITGHTDIKMLMRYSNLRGSDLAERLW